MLISSFVRALNGAKCELDALKNEIKRFNTQRSEDVGKIKGASGLEVLRELRISNEKQRWALRKTGKIHECITNFCEYASRFQDVMDVMVQHHPEYVSLAWGILPLMKYPSSFFTPYVKEQ